MNKYQNYLLPTDKKHFSYTLNGEEIPCFCEDKITIKQDDDITITKYDLHITCKSIDCIYSVSKDQCEIIAENGDQKSFLIKIDFDNRIDAIKIAFVNGLADDLLIPIVYVEADKEKYYAKKEQERKENLLTTASIKVATGADLVNIYFQPCCDEYERTEIQLYIPKEYEVVPGRYGPYKKPSAWSLIKKCKVAVEDFYQSIGGLAYGEYAFILKQYDGNNNLIIETDYITFNIVEPEIYDDSHDVVI